MINVSLCQHEAHNMRIQTTANKGSVFNEGWHFSLEIKWGHSHGSLKTQPISVVKYKVCFNKGLQETQRFEVQSLTKPFIS